MGKWRALFESNLPPVEQREFGEQYEFGLPATAEQIAAAEQTLGIQLPADVREMLSEFNGIWRRIHSEGGEGHLSIHYLDAQHMSVDVPEQLADYEPAPPRYALRRVVFIAQSNGFGDLWGVCTSDVARHKAGTVVRLEHEVGRLNACHPSLAAFVRGGLFSVSTDSVARLTKRDRPPSDLPGLQRRRAQDSFAHWAGTVSPDLIARSEDAVARLLDRLLSLGPKPTKRQIRAAVNACIKRFDELQWIQDVPWIDSSQQKDILDAMHESIDLTGFEADEEWTEIRDW